MTEGCLHKSHDVVKPRDNLVTRDNLDTRDNLVTRDSLDTRDNLVTRVQFRYTAELRQV